MVSGRWSEPQNHRAAEINRQTAVDREEPEVNGQRSEPQSCRGQSLRGQWSEPQISEGSRQSIGVTGMCAQEIGNGDNPYSLK